MSDRPWRIALPGEHVNAWRNESPAIGRENFDVIQFAPRPMTDEEYALARQKAGWRALRDVAEHIRPRVRAGHGVSREYDVDWYHATIADERGQPRRFTGGELGEIDFVLDALWYGVAHENARRKAEHELLAVFGLVEALAGREPKPHRLDLLDTTAWLQAFDILWSPTNIPGDLDPANAVNFRLDVLRAMAAQPRSYRRALVHAMDGYDLEEIADFMGWTMEKHFYDHMGGYYDQVPNEESAERVVRKASSSIRARCSLGIRSELKPPAPAPDTKQLQAGDYTTDVITRIEHEISDTRAWRRREERRRRRAAA